MESSFGNKWGAEIESAMFKSQKRYQIREYADIKSNKGRRCSI